MKALLLLVLLLSVPLLRAQTADPLHETFHVPFEGTPHAVIARGLGESYQAKVDTYGEGKVGQAAYSEKKYTGIRYDGRGNIDLDRGTWAFFYKPLDEPDAEEWDVMAAVTSDIEGYWSGIIQFINKVDINQKTGFALHFFDVGRYSPMLKYQPIYQRWHRDEWHHLALVWDRQHGITLYEDGQRIDSNWGRYTWEWNQVARMINFGNWIYSTSRFAVDEVHAYATCLTDAQIAQLAAGQKPTGPPLDLGPENLDLDRIRYGWTEPEVAALPAVAPDRPLRLVFARIDHCTDAQRQVAQPFEGLPDSCWPLQKYGASTKGQTLQIYFAPGQEFDRMRLFAQRPFRGQVQEIVPGVGTRPLAEVEIPHSFQRLSFGEPRRDAALLLTREYGQLGQLDFYRAEPAVQLPTRLLTWGTARLDRLPPTLAGRAALGDTPARYDNAVGGQRQAPAAWTVASPAFGGFQFLSETLTEPTPMDGVIVKLVTDGLAQPTPVRIVVKEPISTQRDWLFGEAVLEPAAGGGRQTFTVHLQGRPLISMPKCELPLRGKDPYRDPGREVAVLVTAGAPVTWAMGQGGTEISLCLAEADAIRATAVADQTEFAREAYAEINEGHIWDNVANHAWGRLFYVALWLQKMAPETRPAMEIASRVGWRKEPLPWEPPVNDTGAPDWAFWQMQAMRDCRSIIHWIIDHRQTELGEFGGVWGDDTDMVEYWSDYALACNDDRKVTNALRRMWKGVYDHALKDGVSFTIRDALHSYEEGMGCIAHQLLVDYGDPGACERTMRAASHYPKWMKQHEDGTWSFRSNYLGYPGVLEEGQHGEDKGVTHLMFMPAAYLIWYNRNPTVAPYLLNWRRNPVDGIVGDAWYRLKYPDPQHPERIAAYLERYARYNARTQPQDVIETIDEIGLRDEWRAKLETDAKANAWRFFEGALPDYAGYSPRMTEFFWEAYLASGNLDYLVQSYRQACQFVNNQRWLYTEAQPSTDRIPDPRTSFVRARLGSLAVTRGGDGSFWPRHGLSYTAGSEQVAALVTANLDSRLAVRFYCFAEALHRLQVRTWRLLPGQYRLTLSHDADSDGQPEGVIETREVELDRGAYLDLTLPPKTGSILTLDALATHAIDFDQPDAAVGAGDASLEYGDHLHVLVHNLGSKPVENLVVRVRDGYTGAVIGERIVERIESPADLLPKTVLLELTNANAITRRSIVIELDPDRKHADLNRHNNRLEFFY